VKTFVLERQGFNALFDALKRRGYSILGPTVQDSAIGYGPLSSVDDLPIGWTEEQSNAHYRLKRRDDSALFGYTVGPKSWKQFLFPPIHSLYTRQRTGKGFAPPGKNGSAEEEKKLAFIGVRSCELSALLIQDQVFLGGPYADTYYRTARANVFVVAVNCTHAASTCFCASMETGPRATRGYDLALTEIITRKRHYFLAEVGSDRGMNVLKSLPNEEASADEIKEAKEHIEQASRQMGRSVATAGLKELLYQNSEHPRWERTAQRCLSCANCTMVCPTCFCSTVEDVTDLAGANATRVRKWDSCFTLEFSYIHGGSVRTSTRARYRQWLTHKFASWVDQFGTFGCVGCGRCITWCPVGIDVTEEVRAIQDGQSAE
jgi:formate hydrogenlyase subunit 6/NADH:ubiquinone oxidoreductase subunit I